MKVNVDNEGVLKLKELLKGHEDKPQNIRVYIAGMG